MLSRNTRYLACGMVLLSWLIGSDTTSGQSARDSSPNSGDLTAKSLEDLMDVTVTSVSKKEQKLSRTAAAVFVITREDIRRSGATNVPDLLRMVPGLDVAQINGSTWAISSRGFNDQFSNKLLVLVDGRIVYTPNFAGVYWDVQQIPLETIDRIEVIRGPGGTIWGANAVNGVISIFTKKAGDEKGLSVEAGAGTVAQGFGTVLYGGQLNKNTDYRIDTNYFNNSHLLDLNGKDGADGWHMLRGDFRSDSVPSAKDQLTVEGTLYSGREGEFGYELPTITTPGLVPISEQIDLHGGAIETIWKHAYSDRNDSTVQVSFNRYTRGDPLEPETRDTVDVDFQHHWTPGGRHDIVWGFGYHDTRDHIGSSLTVFFVPPSRNLTVENGFVQDEVAVMPGRLYLTLGTKLEHNDYSGFEVMPSGRLVWEASDHHMLWAAVSHALRAPSRNDTNLEVNEGSFTEPNGTLVLLRFEGNPNYADERLMAYEAGYRTTISDWLSIDLAAYYNDYDNVQTTEPSGQFFEATPAPAHLVETSTFQNLMHGEAHGWEVAANWRVTERWSLSPGYAFEQIHMHTKPPSVDPITPLAVENGAPHGSAQLRSYVDLKHGLAWNAAMYYVDPLTNQGPSGTAVIGSYTRMDTGLTWQLRERLSVSVVGQNLLRDHHVEFQDIFGSLQSSEIKRSAYVKFNWRF